MQKTENLAVARRARNLANNVYRLTAGFPISERYGLAAQMRRAAVSIGSNIAEGCGRDGDRALIAFLQIAMGSASELEFQLQLTSDQGLASSDRVHATSVELRQLMRMLARLISALRRHNAKLSTKPVDQSGAVQVLDRRSRNRPPSK